MYTDYSPGPTRISGADPRDDPRILELMEQAGKLVR